MFDLVGFVDLFLGCWVFVDFLANLMPWVCGLLVCLIALVVRLAPGLVFGLVMVVSFMMRVFWLRVLVCWLGGVVMLAVFFWFGKAFGCVCVLLVACCGLVWFRFAPVG